VARATVDERAASLYADFEHQLARQYGPKDLAVEEMVRVAREACEAINRQVEETLAAKGVPAEFAPSAWVSWSRRGENVDPKRRAELRKVAASRIEANAKAAKLELDRQEVNLLRKLAAGALVSGEARTFPSEMPAVDALMPPVRLSELQRGVSEDGE